MVWPVVMQVFSTLPELIRIGRLSDQELPIPHTAPVGSGPVRCRHVLGGFLHDYHREAA
jgi:hypothetical protein